MEYFIQQLVNGITLGSIYGLIAIGYTMVYGIIGMINFAHGDIFMIGAFVALISFIIFGLTGVALPIILLLVLLIAIDSNNSASMFAVKIAFFFNIVVPLFIIFL